MIDEFTCNNKRLACYLIMHGSKLIRIDKDSDGLKYVFEQDDSIEGILDNYEASFKRCMF